MITSATRLIAGLLVTTAIGILLLACLPARKRRLAYLEVAALGFALGLGMHTLYMFLIGLAGIRYTLPVCLAPLAPLAVVATVRIRRSGLFATLRREGEAGRLRTVTRISITVMGLLLAWKIFVCFFTAVNCPTTFDDSVTIWNYKAKVFYYEGLVKDPLHQDFFGGHTPKYPNAVPLFKTWLVLSMDRWNEAGINLLCPIIFLCTGLLIYSNMRTRAPPWLALATSYVAMSTPLFAFHAGFAYADMIVGFYFAAGAIYIDRWLRSRDSADFIVASLLFCTAGWVKDEGLYLFAFSILPGLFLYTLFNRENRPAVLRMGLLVIAIMGFLLGPWIACKLLYNFPLAVVSGDYHKLEFHPDAFDLFRQLLFTGGDYNILWVACAGTFLLYALLPRKRHMIFPVASTILAVGCVLAPFVLTPLFKWLAVGTTLNRAMLTIAPWATFTAGRIVAEWLEQNRKAGDTS